MIANLVKGLNKNPVFRFVSSVKLAVPLLLVLGGVVAYGTVAESRYGAQYAKMVVYNAVWFEALMLLLALNIFAATVSRYPFRKHHTGFVITHIGLLTLLGGGVMTGEMGIDGSLRVVEGQSGNAVVLSNLVLQTGEVNGTEHRLHRLRRGTSVRDFEDLATLNEALGVPARVKRLLPFARGEETYIGGEGDQSGPIAIGFLLKSQFFNVGEWLHETERPEMQMGPARLRIVRGQPAAAGKAPVQAKAAPKAKSENRKPASGAKEPMLVVVDEKSGKELRAVPVAKLGSAPIDVGGVKISLKRVFEQAMVVDNKLDEGGKAGANPALELTLEKDGKQLREVAYARFADFSINTDGTFGVRVQYRVAGAEAASENAAGGTGSATAASAAGMAFDGGDRSGNVIEFQITDNQAERVRVALYKDNKEVQVSDLAPGESVVTPWMGMQVTLGSVTKNSSRQMTVSEAPLVSKQPLPPSAIELDLGASGAGGATESTWLFEGQEHIFRSGDKEYRVYFGPEIIELPFKIHLEKFSKIDYPGTGTPMSFESDVKVNGQGERLKISMNEPLKRDGFTLYQSSYEMEPGRTPASIFSVNQDPGRAVKYIGSLILSIGIIVYTLMKSRVYRKTAKVQS